MCRQVSVAAFTGIFRSYFPARRTPAGSPAKSRSGDNEKGCFPPLLRSGLYAGVLVNGLTKIRVGIPGALTYYLYFPLWQRFFHELGVEVVTSGRTTKEILNQGVREALADACVPVKIFFGHVMALREKVDFLFIPRVVCLNHRTIYCPKFLVYRNKRVSK